MKMKLILTSIITVFCFCAHAQTGLQFSQVKLQQVSLGTATASTASIGTVPAGKVWKLENYLSFSSACNTYLRINGIDYSFPNAGTSTSLLSNNTPLWFPAGTVLELYRVSSCSSAFICAFSLLEFNVVP